MSLLIQVQSLCKSFGSTPLLDDLTFSLFEKDRVGLIGPNGAGKSTFLKILAKVEVPDSGDISAKKGLTIGYVPQACDFDSGTVQDILNQSCQDEHQAEVWLSKLGFKNLEQNAQELSGGWKKRLAVARALSTSPDLLLLDEPTNHLDIESIHFLEEFLLKEVQNFLFVSHDRIFLQKLSNKILEINPIYPKRIFCISGSFDFFQTKREEFLTGQEKTERALKSKARKEVEWLQQSPKARTTKSQSRVDSAKELLNELSDVKKRNIQKTAKLNFEASERQTRKLLVAKNLCKKMNGKPLFENLDFTLFPKTRLGLIGPNGSGKTTLLRLLTGELEPDEGTIKNAEGLSIVYFDQHKLKLPPEMTLKEALCPNGDFVNFRGKDIHVNGWCKQFLFSPDSLRMPIGKLSGGEKARISIAHLMLQPADILLLDEPTNDLDIATLETLEDSLIDFVGALVLITHDRKMLSRVCNTYLSLGGEGETKLLASMEQVEKASFKPVDTKKDEPKNFPKKNIGKLSYLEKKEYDQMEVKIQKLEEKIEKLSSLVSDPITSKDPGELQKMCSELNHAQKEIEAAYIRWEQLESKLKKPMVD